jgi:hypothetical protein
MNTYELLRYGKPSRLGRLDESEWAKLEKSLGALPPDFKVLVSTFGLGSFGDLILFHPEYQNPMFRLPEGSQVGRGVLADEAFTDVLSRFPNILGYVSPRRYLLYGSEGWAIVDSEMESTDKIGSDLGEFIRKAFESLDRGGQLAPLARTIWKSSQDGSVTPFFVAQR